MKKLILAVVALMSIGFAAHASFTAYGESSASLSPVVSVDGQNAILTVTGESARFIYEHLDMVDPESGVSRAKSGENIECFVNADTKVYTCDVFISEKGKVSTSHM